MTIFFEVAKQFLLCGIDDLITLSEKKDNDFINHGRRAASAFVKTTLQSVASSFFHVASVAKQVSTVVVSGHPSEVELRHGSDVLIPSVAIHDHTTLIGPQSEDVHDHEKQELASQPLDETSLNNPHELDAMPLPVQSKKNKKNKNKKPQTLSQEPVESIELMIKHAEPSNEQVLERDDVLDVNSKIHATTALSTTETSVTIIKTEVAPSFFAHSVAGIASSTAFMMSGLANMANDTANSMREGGRNLVLSQAKRERLNQLKEDIKATDGALHDDDMMLRLAQHLHLAAENLAKMGRDQGYLSKSATEDGVSALIALLDQINRKIDLLEWRNQAHDQEPVDMIRHVVATNAAQLLFDRQRSIYELQPPTFVERKEYEIKSTIDDYLRNIARWDVTKSDHNTAKARAAQDCIRQIHDRVKLLDKPRGSYCDTLDACLQQADAKITEKWCSSSVIMRDEGEDVVMIQSMKC